ncbi:hypothetical protein COO60DRAFT_537198 [Scenedesmus sp. NREL 46B-D3]|nr:hypothetical protein COO60DRAFT_537198 [Scenedesmus sp. NREL 46B-D3]
MACASAPASTSDAYDAPLPAEGAAALNGVENVLNSSGSDDLTSAAPDLAVAEQAGTDTTPSESGVHHARIAREAVAEANNVAGEAPTSEPAAPVDVSIAIMPQSLEDALAAVAAAAAAMQHEQMQQPFTSGAQPLYSAASPADSMAGQASDSNGAAVDVDVVQAAARMQRKEQPAFIQTSSLISNSCGYCGTRNTSGCWRRGWEMGGGKFINLCNKCGLRHKSGKLQSVPLPSPPQRRNPAAAGTNGSSTPSRPGHRGSSQQQQRRRRRQPATRVQQSRRLRMLLPPMQRQGLGCLPRLLPCWLG